MLTRKALISSSDKQKPDNNYGGRREIKNKYRIASLLSPCKRKVNEYSVSICNKTRSVTSG